MPLPLIYCHSYFSRHTAALQVKQMKEISKDSGISIHASRTLATLGRKLHSIKGDGNCFFRALSYIMYGTEDRHSSIRASIALFSELNVECFKKYCTASKVMEHIRCMKHQAIFATQMEAHATASCIQRTVYIFTQKRGSGEYYWEKFDPLPPHTLKLLPVEYRILLHPFMVHLELCHVNNCHYDVVTMFNGELSPYPPPRPTTLSHIDLT